MTSRDCTTWFVSGSSLAGDVRALGKVVGMIRKPILTVRRTANAPVEANRLAAAVFDMKSLHGDNHDPSADEEALRRARFMIDSRPDGCIQRNTPTDEEVAPQNHPRPFIKNAGGHRRGGGEKPDDRRGGPTPSIRPLGPHSESEHAAFRKAKGPDAVAACTAGREERVTVSRLGVFAPKLNTAETEDYRSSYERPFACRFCFPKPIDWQ